MILLLAAIVAGALRRCSEGLWRVNVRQMPWVETGKSGYPKPGPGHGPAHRPLSVIEPLLQGTVGGAPVGRGQV
ncbi:MAG: hypothetical protein QOJ19_3351, partial [Acidimicrobiia bacterium]|nr:hypothetical protein [Acidimicrobiia bacterium]